MIKSKPCKLCKSIWHTKAFCPLNRKPIKPGKHTLKDRAENKKFRDSKADYRGFFTCSSCGVQTQSIDVDHIKTKGSRPDLRYEESNKRLLCRPCHTKRHS